MNDREPKRVPKPPDAFREVEGFDTKKNGPGSTARPDPGAVRPVDPVPEASAAKRDGGERKRRRRFSQPLSEPERALAKDAAAQARRAELSAAPRWGSWPELNSHSGKELCLRNLLDASLKDE